MQHYCGIDLHSNNHVVVIINEEDKRVFEKRLGNNLSQTLKVLQPYQDIHGRLRFAKLSVNDFKKVKIAAIHPDFL